jgi:site-specific recombinase XerD
VTNFLRWCRHADLLDHDPMVTIERPREPRRMPVTLSDGEITRLLKVVPDLRGDVIVRLMLDLGFRCIDVHRLEVGDLDFERMLVTVHGKGGHVDVLPLPSVTARSIRRYLDKHPVSSGPLVRAYDANRALSAQRMSELLAQWMRDAGIKRRRLDGRGAHALRRTCATTLLDEGANVRQVQAVLRHQSMSTTARYLRCADAESLRAILERA